MKVSNKSNAQGTIEYLVIIAVVVVISLVVVSLMTTIFSSPAEQISSSTNKIGAMTGAINIVDAIADSSGDGTVTFSNNSGETLVITGININGVNNTYSSQLVPGNETTFSVTSLIACENSKKVYSIIIYYTSPTGLTKELNLGQIQINCSDDTVPVKPPEEHLNCIPSGTGTISKPKIICDCNGLQEINNHLDWNYALGADINCYDTRTWRNGRGFEPMNSLIGSLDGRNHTVSDFYINDTNDYIDDPDHYILRIKGLFRGTEVSGEIKNISFTNAYVNSGIEAGILVGETHNGTIQNCNVSGQLIGYGYVGGLVSINFGAINNCDANVVIGRNEGYSQMGFSGGLVSRSYGTIQNSSANVTITGNFEESGGICATSNNPIINCYSSGSISGAQISGGIAAGTFGEVTNSYSSVSVNGTAIIGGLIGDAGGPVTNSFSTGNVSGTAFYKAGFIGRNYATVTNSFWDKTTSGLSTACGLGDCSGVTGKNTANAEPNYFFDGNNPPMGPKPTSWDFTTIWNDNNSTLQYPTLK